MLDYFERKLRLKDLEVWDARIGRNYYRIILIDENRPATFDDFHTPNLILNADDIRTNFVSVRIFSENVVDQNHIEDLADFSKQLTNHLALAHCEVIIDFRTEHVDIALNRLLVETYGIKESDIPLEKLWHLNQD